MEMAGGENEHEESDNDEDDDGDSDNESICEEPAYDDGEEESDQDEEDDNIDVPARQPARKSARVPARVPARQPAIEPASKAAQEPDGTDEESSSDDDEEPTLELTTSAEPRVRITKSGEEKYWMEHSRKKVVSCAPSKSKKFILYLPLTPDNMGSKHMIDTDLNLQELALKHGGPESYSKEMSSIFNQHHRKAKSQLNRSIVLGLTRPMSEFQMAHNVMSGKAGPMALDPSIAHLETIANLVALFDSDHLYTDEKVHLSWVGLFASGTVYGCNRAGVNDTLDMMVDVDYEAHARYEMISRLSCQGWRHGYTPQILAVRSKEFRRVRKLVRLDRLNNLKAAEAKRLNTTVNADDEEQRQQALGSGGLADTTDEEDGF